MRETVKLTIRLVSCCGSGMSNDGAFVSSLGQWRVSVTVGHKAVAMFGGVWWCVQ